MMALSNTPPSQLIAPQHGHVSHPELSLTKTDTNRQPPREFTAVQPNSVCENSNNMPNFHETVYCISSSSMFILHAHAFGFAIPLAGFIQGKVRWLSIISNATLHSCSKNGINHK